MFDAIRDLFATAEEITLSPDEARAFFEEEMAEELQEVRERAETFRDDIRSALSDVEDALTDLETFTHDHSTIEDVTTNVARKRLRIIRSFDPPPDPEAFHAALEEMLEEFSLITQKERAVLEQTGGPVKDVSEAIADLKRRASRFGEFLETDYTLIDTRAAIETALERWKSCNQRMTELEEERSALDIASLEQERDEIAAEIAELDDDPRNAERERLMEEISALREEKEELQKRIERAASQLDRGLKKLLYAARNYEASLSQDAIDVLEVVRAGNLFGEDAPPAHDIAEGLEEACDALPDIDLGERQRRTFQENAEIVQEIDGVREQMEAIEEKIAEKQEECADLALDEERTALEEEKQEISERIAEREEKKKEIERNIEKMKEERSDAREKIQVMLNNVMRHDITVEA